MWKGQKTRQSVVGIVVRSNGKRVREDKGVSGDSS